MEDDTYLKKYMAVLDQVTRIQHYILWKGAVPTDLPPQMQGKVITWKQLMDLGQKK